MRMPGAVVEGWSGQELSLSEADVLAVRDTEIEHYIYIYIYFVGNNYIQSSTSGKIVRKNPVKQPLRVPHEHGDERTRRLRPHQGLWRERGLGAATDELRSCSSASLPRLIWTGWSGPSSFSKPVSLHRFSSRNNQQLKSPREKNLS